MSPLILFPVRILFIGDIVGSPGRQIVHDRLADLVTTQKIDLVIANCENAASGFGITPRLAQELLGAGIHVLTGGNHIFDRREILEFFPHEPRLLRPANFPAANPGSGLYLGTITPRDAPITAASDATAPYKQPSFGAGSPAPATDFRAGSSGIATAATSPASEEIPSSGADSPAPDLASQIVARDATTPVKFAVLNLQGRVFMAPNDCPFKTADRELARIPPEVKIIIVDMHAEATSEKIAMGWYLDGRVTAVIGTHTHVASADERVLPGGAAHITDVGMTGPHNGIIGMEKSAILGKFLDGLPTRFSVAEGDTRMNCVVIDADPTTGKSHSIARLALRAD